MTNQPRYEISIEAPFLTWGKGTILIPAEDGEMYSKEHGYSPSHLKLYLKDMDKFPRVFRLLKWWERTPVEDFPKYVKLDGGDGVEYLHIKEWNRIKPNKDYYDGNLFTVEEFDVHGKLFTWGFAYAYDGEIFPATAEEYITYQQSQKEK